MSIHECESRRLHQNGKCSTWNVSEFPLKRKALRFDDLASGSEPDAKTVPLASRLAQLSERSTMLALLKKLVFSDEGSLAVRVLMLFPWYRRKLLRERNKKMNGGFY